MSKYIFFCASDGGMDPNYLIAVWNKMVYDQIDFAFSILDHCTNSLYGYTGYDNQVNISVWFIVILIQEVRSNRR